MEPALPPLLETKRLRLRAYEIGDFEHFAAFYASSRSIHADGPASRSLAWAWFAAGTGRWSLVGYGAWAVERKADRASVGLVSLNYPVIEGEERELGWILWEGFEGHGYAAEAATEARRYAFKELGWSTLVSYIGDENSRSVRLAEAMGATLDRSASERAAQGTLVYRHERPRD